jgi:hypothetical protein
VRKTLNLIFLDGGFDAFVEHISDLQKVSDVVKMKIDDKNMLLYSAVSTKNGNFMQAMKTNSIRLADICEVKSGEIPDIGIDFIIQNPKQFIKNCKLFVGSTVEMSLEYIAERPKIAKELAISNDSIRIRAITGDPSLIQDITKSMIDNKLNVNNKDFSFIIDKENLDKVKKLAANSNIEVMRIVVKGGLVKFLENGWEITVATCPDYEEMECVFLKKYLKSIERTDEVEFNVFEHFMLVVEGDSKLLIGLEIDYD